ncbi:unnamed protein product [Hymenolepis diminuta]|uniref:Purine nucleoside phosphorylase n=2 Tax=Hymenolepis diminuta TaxID=6216 RepID=A0A564Y109_HYMDI|nr:unnamed protein product [Hymenolepis diminuta]
MASYDEVNAACEYLRKKISIKPQVGLICGSGLGKLGDGVLNPIVIPYEEIPNFPKCSVEGHFGNLIFGVIGNKYVMLMQGRLHGYEGYTQQQITLPIRVMKLMGCEYLIVTNATGTVHLNYNVGDLMVVKDHISIPALAGFNPLCGPNDERFGTRFPALSDIYTKELRQLAFKVADEMGISNKMHEGVYMCVFGPTFDTISEDRALRLLGADVLGMSLTAETIVAHHCGMKVLAISLVTNRCTFERGKPQSSHQEVLQAGLESSETIAMLITQILEKL